MIYGPFTCVGPTHVDVADAGNARDDSRDRLHASQSPGETRSIRRRVLANELAREFKHQKRQTRVFKSTLESLKSLQMMVG